MSVHCALARLWCRRSAPAVSRQCRIMVCEADCSAVQCSLLLLYCAGLGQTDSKGQTVLSEWQAVCLAARAGLNVTAPGPLYSQTPRPFSHPGQHLGLPPIRVKVVGGGSVVGEGRSVVWSAQGSLTVLPPWDRWIRIPLQDWG